MKYFYIFFLSYLFILMSCQEKIILTSELDDGLYANINTSQGNILVELYPEQSPLTVMNFVGLAEGNFSQQLGLPFDTPFYDKLEFHRVVDDFVIQTGQLSTVSNDTQSYTFPNEYSSLNFNEAGMLGMANRGIDTNSTQFFINLTATPELNDAYTVFAKVIQGHKILKKISTEDHINAIEIIRQGAEAQKYEVSWSDFQELKEKTIQINKENIKKINEELEKQIKTYNPSYLMINDTSYAYLIIQEGSEPILNPNQAFELSIALKDMDDNELSQELTDTITNLDEQLLPDFVKIHLKQMKNGEERLIFLPPSDARNLVQGSLSNRYLKLYFKIKQDAFNN